MTSTTVASKPRVTKRPAPALREKLISIFETLSLKFVAYDSATVVTYISAEAKQFPYAAKLRIGSSLSESLELPLDPIFVQAYRNALERQEEIKIDDYISNSLQRRALDLRIIPVSHTEFITIFDDALKGDARAANLERSERRFELVSQSITMPLVLLDDQFKVTYWNPSAASLTNIPASEAIGVEGVALFPGLSEEVVAQIKQAYVERKPFTAKRLRYEGRRGSYWFSIRVFPVGTEIAVLLEDKTAQATAERELARSEVRFRGLAENLSIALVMVSRDRRITYWNHAAEKRAEGGITEHSLGADAVSVLPLSEPRLDELLARARSGETGVRIRVEPEREGVRGTYDIRAFPVGEEVSLLIEDVTQQVLQATELDSSNHKLLDLYNNAPCGYLSVLPNGKITQINLTMVGLLGYSTQEEFDHLGLQEILTPESLAQFLEELSSSGLESPLTNIELGLRRKDGSVLRGLVNALPSFDPIEKVWSWRWTVVDITELRAVQTQIEDSRLFTQLFNELGEAVLISDRDGKIVRANQAATRILGMSNEELTSLRHDASVWKTILADGSSLPTSEMPAVRALREKRAVPNVELGVVGKGGDVTWILESAAPLFDERGDVTGAIVTFPEVTATVEQRRALKDLNESLAIERDRANEANRLKSSFLANMSHEIRTPMTAILGFSDILSGELEGIVSDQQHTFLRSINVSGKRLLSLINDILDLSKIEAGRLELQSEPLDMFGEIEAVVTSLSYIAKQKGLSIVVEPAAERFVMRGDHQRFGQVLTNIISNAIKFTRHGGITISVEEQGRDQVAVSVTDTGIGMSAEFLPHLFEEFRQEHMGVTREFGGTGLGLAISRRLVAIMGGKIEVSSQLKVGTTFRLTFPRMESVGAMAGRSGRHAIIQPLPKAQEPAAALSEELGEKKLVLVVEDNVETQRLMEVYLKQKYRVIQAANSIETMEKLGSQSPDVILMDVNMPGKDGLTVTKEIREGAVCPNVPIIAVTALAMTGDKERCLEAGCNDYISKPATKREVLDVVERVLAPVEH